MKLKLLCFIQNTTISKTLFPSTVIKCDKSNSNLRSTASLSVFKKNLLTLS